MGATEIQYRSLLQKLSGQYASIARDKYASHVLEKIFAQARNFLRKEISETKKSSVSEADDAAAAAEELQASEEETNNVGEEPKDGANDVEEETIEDSEFEYEISDESPPLPMSRLIKRVSQEIFSEADKVIDSTHGSFTIRSLLRLISGFKMPVANSKKQNKYGLEQQQEQNEDFKQKRNEKLDSVGFFFGPPFFPPYFPLLFLLFDFDGISFLFSNSNEKKNQRFQEIGIYLRFSSHKLPPSPPKLLSISLL